MSSLSQLGVNGLLAVNSWIGMINSNLISSSRTAYKTTRPTLLDGVVNTIGDQLQIPSPTLNVQATTIEWAQGAIINSNSRANFALQGQGFFVVVDANGKFYLTRDGEFHWDGNGYLVNSAGLRVVSSGQDFIRYGRGDESDLFDPNGQSVQFDRYGDKSFLVVDVANRQGLYMSRYGSTIFEVDGDLPLRVQNSFDQTMDGLTFVYTDPKQQTYVGDQYSPPFVMPSPGQSSDFSIDLGGNGIFNFNDFNPLGANIDFDPSANTIQDILDALNAYATANNINVSASYDPDTDRLTIINIPEPKVVDPFFRPGNFAIDFGDNGLFTYHGFDPSRTTIAQIVAAIKEFAFRNNVNITADYFDGADNFVLTNTVTSGNNKIVFDGANGAAMAAFMQVPITTPSNGGTTMANTLTTNPDGIDRNPNPTATNPFADISAQDVQATPLSQLIKPSSQIRFGGINGQPIAQFFRMSGALAQTAIDSVNGYVGTQLTSSRDIDNSAILFADPALANRHSLDILPTDVGTRFILDYTTQTDTTTPVFDFSGVPPVHFHDKQNGVVTSGITGSQGLGILAIGQAQQTDAFDLVVDFRTDTALLGLNFGYNKPEQIDSGGFSIYYDPSTGDTTLTVRSRNPNDPPVVLGAGSLPAAAGLTGTVHRLSSTLDADGHFTLSIDGSVPVKFSLAGFSQQSAGYLSISHNGNQLELHNLYADFKGQMNHQSTGELVSVGMTPYASSEVREGSQDRERTRIVQSALESSTASLTEYIPMLGLAQKVFSSLSKIISTGIAITDDVNSLIR